MKRLINVRPLLFAAVGLITGIYCAFCFAFGNIAMGVVCLVLLVALGIFFVCTKSANFKYLLLVALMVAVGITQMAVYQHSSQAREIVERDVVLVGRVTDLGRFSPDSKIVYLEKCTDENGNKYTGRIKTYTFDNSTLQVGDIVTIKGTLRSTYPLQAKVQTSYVRNDVRYTLSEVEILSYKAGKLTLGEIARRYIFDACSKFGTQSAPIVYALLTGDCNAIAEEDSLAFRRTGTLHLLAVSGQHIVFIVGVLNVLVKRLKLHPAVEMVVMLLTLVFFCYICNWVPSIMRALVMLLCGYIARIIYGRYDMLSSLSLSVIVILLWHPLYLFDVGFQLSALSVYGIATIYSVYQRKTIKRKMNKIVRNVLDSFVLSLCCTAAIMFTTAYNFGEVSVVAPFVNVIAVPVVSIAFVVAMAGLLPWVFHYLLTVAGWLLGAVAYLVRGFSAISFASAKATTLGISIVIAVILLFTWGGSVNLSKVGKRLFSAICVVLLVVCTVIAVVPNRPTEKVKVFFGYNDIALVATNNSDMAVVTNLADEYVAVDVLEYAQGMRVDNCTLYLVDYVSCDQSILADFCQALPVNKVYVMDRSFNDNATALLSQHKIPLVVAEKNTILPGSISVQGVYDGSLRGVVVTIGELCVSTVYGSDAAIQNYPFLRSDVDVYIAQKAFDTFAQQNKATLSFYQQNILYNFGSNKYGVFTIIQKDGTIKVSFK